MPRRYKAIPKDRFDYDGLSVLPIRDEDKYMIMTWRNEQIDILRQEEPLTKEKQEWYFANVVDRLFDAEQPDQLLFSVLQDNILIGYGGLVHIDWKNKNAEVSFINATSRSKSDQFVADWKGYLSILKGIVQQHLGFEKIFTYAYDVRPRLYEALKDQGFKEEARLSRHVIVNGKFYDVLIHSYFFDDLQLRKGGAPDLEFYFHLANDPAVRGNSINTGAISLDDHKEWFKKKLESDSSLLFVASLNRILVGQIRFDRNDDGSYEIDFSLQPEYRGRGLGTKILQEGLRELMASNRLVKKVTAKVKTQNLSSKRSFEKNGFRLESIAGNGLLSYVLEPLGR